MTTKLTDLLATQRQVDNDICAIRVIRNLADQGHSINIAADGCIPVKLTRQSPMYAYARTFLEGIEAELYTQRTSITTKITAMETLLNL